MNNRTPEQQAALDLKLNNAARAGKVADILTLIDEGAEINSLAGPSLCSALDMAAYHNHLEVVMLLIRLGANINQTRGAENQFAATPLYIAAQQGNVKVVEYLIAKGADVNQARTDNKTPMTVAAQSGHIITFKLLLSNGASCNNMTSDNETALFLAARNGETEIVELLIKQLILKFPLDKLILFMEMHHIFRRSLAASANVKTRAALYKLIEHMESNNISRDALKGLLPEASEADLIAELYKAVKNHDHKMIISLIQRGVDINKVGSGSIGTVLDSAAFSGDIETARLLIENGAKVNTGRTTDAGTTPLLLAAQQGQTACVALLLKNDADPTITMKLGSSPLAIAAKNGHTESIDLIVNAIISEFTVNKLVGLLKKQNMFRLALKEAKNGASFLALFRLVDHLRKSGVSDTDIMSIMPEADSFQNKSFKNNDIKNDILEHIKTLPINERITMCNNALDEHHPLGYIMFMQRGSTTCKLGHGRLKEIAAIRDEALKCKASEVVTEPEKQEETINQFINGRTKLMLAVAKGDLAEVQQLILDGAEVNQLVRDDGLTAMIIAVDHNQLDIAKLLLENGADTSYAWRMSREKWSVLNLQWQNKNLVERQALVTGSSTKNYIPRFSRDCVNVSAERLAEIKGYTEIAALISSHNKKLAQPVTPVVAAITSTAEITATLSETKTSHIYPSTSELKAAEIEITPYVPVHYARVELLIPAEEQRIQPANEVVSLIDNEQPLQQDLLQFAEQVDLITFPADPAPMQELLAFTAEEPTPKDLITFLPEEASSAETLESLAAMRHAMLGQDTPSQQGFFAASNTDAPDAKYVDFLAILDGLNVPTKKQEKSTAINMQMRLISE